MSNCHNPVEKAVKRRKLWHISQKDVQAPQCVVDYNENMGVIDDINQVRVLCSTRLRSYKWYFAIFFFLLDSCLNNAFSLFCKHHKDTPLGKWRRRQFYKNLCKELLRAGGIDVDNIAASGETKTTSFSHKDDMLMRPRVAALLQPGTPEFDNRLRGGCHYLANAEGCKNCCLCAHAGAGRRCELKVIHFCKQCGVHLHAECFEPWHEMLEPISPKFMLKLVKK